MSWNVNMSGARTPEAERERQAAFARALQKEERFAAMGAPRFKKRTQQKREHK